MASEELKNPERGPAGPWWKEGVRIFSEVTGWIVVPILAALYAGRYLDERFGTANVYFLLLTGLAFVVSCVGIGVIGARYIRSIEQSDKKKNGGK